MRDEASPLAVPTSVKERRKLLGWTQAALAHEAGLSTTAVHNLEAGKNGFTDKTLLSIANALKCRPADLLLPLDESERPIVHAKEILEVLGRIKGLSQTDVEVAFAVIHNALQAKRGGSAQRAEDDQSAPPNLLREGFSSR